MPSARLRWSYKDEVGGWKGYDERLGLRYDRETIDAVRWRRRDAMRCDGVSLFSVDGLTRRPLCDDDGAVWADVKDV